MDNERHALDNIMTDIKIIQKSVKGIGVPEHCLKLFKDHFPLSQMISSEEPHSFYCVCHNSEGIRDLPQDRFTVCFKNEDFDEMANYDDSDIKDMIMVLSHALSVDEHMRRYEDKKSIVVKNPTWK